MLIPFCDFELLEDDFILNSEDVKFTRCYHNFVFIGSCRTLLVLTPAFKTTEAELLLRHCKIRGFFVL